MLGCGDIIIPKLSFGREVIFKMSENLWKLFLVWTGNDGEGIRNVGGVGKQGGVGRRERGQFRKKHVNMISRED